MRWGWGEQCPFLLWNGPGASHMLGKHATTQLHPYPSLFVIIFIHVFGMYFWGGYTLELQCIYRGQRRTWKSWFFPSTTWDPESKLRSSRLATSIFISWTILPGLLYFRNMVSLIKFSKMASYYIAHAGLDFACTTMPGSHINLKGNILCNSYMFQNHSTVSKINTDYVFWSK